MAESIEKMEEDGEDDWRTECVETEAIAAWIKGSRIWVGQVFGIFNWENVNDKNIKTSVYIIY